MSMAVPSSAAYTAAGDSGPALSSISAATAAAWGAEAEVPKKFGKPSGSLSNPKNVVFVPSGATISGLSRSSEVGRPRVSKRIGVGPAEEYHSSCGGAVPNAGVSR